MIDPNAAAAELARAAQANEDHKRAVAAIAAELTRVITVSKGEGIASRVLGLSETALLMEGLYLVAAAAEEERAQVKSHPDAWQQWNAKAQLCGSLSTAIETHYVTLTGPEPAMTLRGVNHFYDILREEEASQRRREALEDWMSRWYVRDEEDES